MLSFVERFIWATFFLLCSVQNFNITTIQCLETCVYKNPRLGLAATSFVSLSLRTHPHLTFSMRSKWHLFLFCFFWKKKWHRRCWNCDRRMSVDASDADVCLSDNTWHALALQKLENIKRLKYKNGWKF